jgi:hypothetical protein
MADRKENDQSCSSNQSSDQPFFKAIESPDDHAKFPRNAVQQGMSAKAQ